MITKLSRKDIKMLESSAKNNVNKGALEEYLSAHKKAETAWKVFRDSLILSEGSSENSFSKEVKSEKARKFKAGDKVRVLSTAGDVATAAGLSVGDITEVVAYKGDSPKEWDSNSKRQVIVKGLNYFAESALELVVEEEKTPNELRAELIQRAKDILNAWKWENNSGHDGYRNLKLSAPYHNWVMVVEFVVNVEKRTVVALLRGYESFTVATKGIAKCHSDDVFNEHIGKAIALGRALGKDVSEFENAIQPTEPVVGHVVNGNENLGFYRPNRKFTLTSKQGYGLFYYAESAEYASDNSNDYIYSTQIGAIIDDTGAQYE